MIPPPPPTPLSSARPSPPLCDPSTPSRRRPCFRTPSRARPTAADVLRGRRGPSPFFHSAPQRAAGPPPLAPAMPPFASRWSPPHRRPIVRVSTDPAAQPPCRLPSLAPPRSAPARSFAALAPARLADPSLIAARFAQPCTPTRSASPARPPPLTTSAPAPSQRSTDVVDAVSRQGTFLFAPPAACRSAQERAQTCSPACHLRACSPWNRFRPKPHLRLIPRPLRRSPSDGPSFVKRRLRVDESASAERRLPLADFSIFSPAQIPPAGNPSLRALHDSRRISR